MRGKWINMQKNHKKLYHLFVLMIPVIIGIIAFITIYGVNTLNVTNDRWIFSGYDEPDINQHYAGWLAYRNSEWQFPLGMASHMSVGVGTIISYTDSIPLVAIFFKLFRLILPKTFQYFGIFTLLCYILQSIAAFKIIYRKTRDVTYSSLGSLLFAFAPILMERAFRHTALGAQWLILFSIDSYLKYREDKKKTVYFKFLLLELLSVGIHPYFLPMVACFALGCVYYDLKDKKYQGILYFSINQVITYAFGVLLGVLGSGISPSRDGFGFFSMNLNSLINPISAGGYQWSSFFQTKPLILGNYDGFNYLGAGIVAFIILLFGLIIGKTNVVMQWVKNHFYLILMSLGLTIFAISNVVTFNNQILFSIHLPSIIEKLCSIFRASSRMFYPVYYLLFFSLILLLWKILHGHCRKYAYVILIGVVCIQLFNLHHCIIQKHQAMKNKNNEYSYIDDEELNQHLIGANHLLVDHFENKDLRNVAILAFKNQMKIYYSVANSGSYSLSKTLQDEILSQIKETRDIQDNVIVTTSLEVANEYVKLDDIDCYQIDGMYFIYHR